MIVNIRGGSGSGKSTVVREIMEHYPMRVPRFVEGRKRPLWYDLYDDADADPDERPDLRVLGHYEAPCGGCDTISKNPSDPDEKAMAFIHRLVREADDEGINVLYEGVILTTILGGLPELYKEGRPVVVVNLTSDLETCLLGISERRAAKEGDCDRERIAFIRSGLTETTVKNNIGKLKSAMKTATQLRNLGVKVFDCDRAQALATVEEVLEL